MSEKKIVVPQEMCDAIGREHLFETVIDAKLTLRILETALRWLTANSPELTDEQAREAYLAANTLDLCLSATVRAIARESVSRMFLAPEPIWPGVIADLLVNPVIGTVNGSQINDRIEQAFRRGQKAGPQ